VGLLAPGSLQMLQNHLGKVGRAIVNFNTKVRGVKAGDDSVAASHPQRLDEEVATGDADDT
jgi:hypothetical protein